MCSGSHTSSEEERARRTPGPRLGRASGRAFVLNNELRQIFRRWYPGMQNAKEEIKEAA